ncbi:hypothetical protein HY029_03175 [Candidatus Gottesmanbacteria bacterium]|nr:hypothetical protein [Candidatus Gottesmanbacteria bacterium]
MVNFISPLNGEIKVVEFFGKLILYVNDAEQSGGTIAGMWQKAVKKVQSSKFKVQSCLILGLGGGTVIKILQKYYPEVYMDVIEFDLAIIDIAKKYFDIGKIDNLNIINADAFKWIKQVRNNYDLIIFDLYVGKTNPRKSRTIDFLKDLKKILKKAGIILFNAHYQNDEGEYDKLLKDCRQVFTIVDLILIYPYSRILRLR